MKRECNYCNGKGFLIYSREQEQCPFCMGKGEIEIMNKPSKHKIKAKRIILDSDKKVYRYTKKDWVKVNRIWDTVVTALGEMK